MRMKQQSGGVSDPSRTELIWAGQICGQCDEPLGDGPVIRIGGSYLGLSYLGTERWGGQTICRSCYGGKAPAIQPCAHCGRPTGFLPERRQLGFCSDRCRTRDAARRLREARGH